MAFHINDFANIAAYQTFISAHSELYPQLCLFEDSMTVSAAANADEDPYAPEPGPGPTPNPRCLTFHSDNENGLHFYFDESASNTVTLQYSYNKVQWYDWDFSNNLAFGSTSGDLYIRGNNPTQFNTADIENCFGFTNDDTDNTVAISGNIMHLLDYTQDLTTIPCESCFRVLFSERGSVYDISGMTFPATTLTKRCYLGMFDFCENLTLAPATLPATVLAEECYVCMFRSTKITTAPELCGLELVNKCYRYMFEDCTSLTSIQMDAVEVKSATNPTEDWVKNITTTGTLYVTSTGLDVYGEAGDNTRPSTWTTQLIS